MRKLFMLCAAMLMALAVNAAIINIDTNTTDALRVALAGAADGDEIVMAAGTYVESNSNFIAFDKNITVKAAEGANVIIQAKVSATISEGKTAKLVGIKWDASHLNDLQSWYEHVIYAADATAGNTLILENCEFYGFNKNNSLIYCSSANKLDSVAVNNCYFHNITKSCLFFENTDMAAVTVINSTFANIAQGETGSYYAGNIFVKGTSTNVYVDHCTFYDINTMNTDYGAVKVKPSTNATVSNCVFMMPTSFSGGRAVYNAGGVVNNCLTYNYTKDSNTGIHSGPTITACITGDPLFADAANGDFTLGANSPALTAGADGGAIGDPRWAPHVQVLEDGYYLIGRINGDSLATWTVADLNATRLFEANPAAAGEYMLTATLAAGDELQVVQVAGDAITNWFPGGEGNNYVVDANHAGEKTIYFRPDRQGASDWLMGCIYIAANGTNINNVDADVKAVKFIMNGKVFIRVNGENYTVLGQKVEK